MKYKYGDRVYVEAKVIETVETNGIDCWEIHIQFDNEETSWIPESAISFKSRLYEQGLQDAWELAMRICGTDDKILQKTFASKSEVYIFANNTPQEALAKLKAYEEEQAIKVGDVIKAKNGLEFLVTYIDKDSILHGVAENGDTYSAHKNICEKTGKHIDIESLLGQIRSE